jgi:NAD(P)-dependent dehydrogenase (short-subunit alcohol dehydrogenase family)
VDALRAQGADARLVLIDVADLGSVDRAAALVSEEFPKLSLLVNNAGPPGYPMRAPGWTFDASTLENLWRTDFLGAFELVKRLIPTLAANCGTVLNVSSPADPVPQFNTFAYAASKAPLNVLTKSFGLAFEQEGVPITIFGVTPGGVSTDLNGHIEGPYVKTPEQAAAGIVGFLFDGVDHNGQLIHIDGRVYRTILADPPR